VTELIFVLVALHGLALVALTSGFETGAYALNHARLRLGVAEGDRRARLLSRLVADLPAFLAVLVVGRAAAHALVSFAVTLFLERIVPERAELFGALAVAPLVFVLGELGPKELFRRHADGLMAATAPVLALGEAIFVPAVRLTGAMRRALAALGLREKVRDERALAAEELRLTIQASAEEGVLTAFQAALVRNILSLRHRLVTQAMVPIARVHALEAKTPVAEAREAATRAGCSRLVVYSGKLEEATGAVGLYELFLDGSSAETVEPLAHPVPRIAASDRVEDALLRLRLAREKLAIVQGPDGKAVGIVTLKDLCEEITGELEDL